MAETYQEWKKRKYGIEPSPSSTNTSSSGSTKTTGNESYEEWKKRKAEEGTLYSDQQRAEARNFQTSWGLTQRNYNKYVTEANDFLQNVSKDYISGGKNDTAERLRSQGRDLLKWFDQYGSYFDADAYRNIVGDLQKLDSAYGDVMDFYSQFETQDAYDMWDAYSTTENRQERYEQNQKRLSELEAEKIKVQNDMNTFQPGTNPYTYGGYSVSGAGYGAAAQNFASGNSGPQAEKLNALNDEINSIKREMTMYERGSTDADTGFYYGSKVVDDYSAYLNDPNYGQFSAEDFQNPTKDDLRLYDAMMDQSTWYQDGRVNTINRMGDIVTVYVNADDPRYQIADPLGAYLQATPEDLANMHMHGDGNTQLGVLDQLLMEGYYGNWEQLDEKERGIYYTLLGTQGKEAAMKYLSDMETELNRRNMAQESELYKLAFERANGWQRLGMSAVSIPANLLGGATAFVDDLSHTVRGEDINPYSAAHQMQNYGQQVRANQAAAFDESSGWEIPGIGFSAGDLYQAAMSTADMFGGAMIGPTAYGALMGMGAASSEARRLYEMGASREQIFWGSAAAGAAEMVFEKFSIEKLIDIKDADTLGKLVLNALKQGGVEASEEGATELANLITNNLIMTSESDWAKLVESNNGNKWAAARAAAGQIGEAAAGGFVSGLIGGTGSATMNYAQNYRNDMDQGKAILEADALQPLRDLAMEMAARKNDKAQADLQKQSEQLGKEFVYNFTRYRAAGRLYRTVQNTVSEANKADVANALQKKGYTQKQAQNIADAFYTQAIGMEVSKDQQKVISKYGSNENVQKVIGDLLLSNKSSIAQRNKNLSDFAFDVETGILRSRAEAAAKKIEAETKDTTEETTASEPSLTVSEDGETHLISDPQQTVKISGFESVKDGKVMLRTENGEVVPADDISYGSESDALVYEAIANLGTTVSASNALLQAYKGKNDTDAEIFARGIQEAFEYGQLGIPMTEMADSAFASKLSKFQMEYAYKQGKKAAGKRTAKAEAVIRKNQNASKKSSDGKVHFEGSRDGLNERQRVSLDALETVAKATGIQIYVYESKVGANGQRIGANGWYNQADGSIHIDLYAGQNAEAVMLFTAAHELTHFIAQWSPRKFKVLANFIMEEYGNKDVSVENLINDQIDKAKRNGRELSRDEAYEEVIADSMETMLADGNVVQKLARLQQKDRTLVQKIKDFIDDLVNRIHKVYSGMVPNSAEGKYVAEMKESVEKIQQIFTDALMEASGNYQMAEKNATIAVKKEAVEKVGISVDAKTESAAPIVMMSERTWTESDYVQERAKAAKEIAKAIGVSERKAKAYIDSVNSIAKMIADDRNRLDYFSSPNRSSFVSNVEYGGSFDFSTLCKKRRLLTGTFTAIQKALPNTALTADEILDIRNRMKDAGLEVSCGLCYVEGSRANMGQFAKEFLRLYKQYYPDAWQPNMADVNTPEGIEWVRINHPEVYEQYEYFWNHYGTLKSGDKNLFASQQKPKLYQLHTEYKGEILQKFKNEGNIDAKNLNGGIRLQSFSDFEIVHLIDTMQIIMDMSRVGLAGQAYTKVPDFAWALGDTGLKINLSLIAKGVDENGKLIFDDVEGMPIDTAVALRNHYSKNVGTILVAFNDEQLLAAMADDRVDFIIPFHRSQWKKSQYAAMGLPAKTKDYTYMQNEKFIKPQYHEYRGRMVKDKATNYMPNEYWDFSKSGKENAEAYLEMCARNNKRPKFYKLLKNNGDGSYSLKADGSTDGYWKLLIDFKMYDNNGNGSPQTPVVPRFNMEEAQRMLNDYKGGHSTFPVAQGIVDDFVNEYKDRHKNVQYSDRDTVERAKEYFGTTTDFEEAGFILPSGEMLKFTDDKHRGERQYDHRAIGIAYGVNVDLNVNHGFNEESSKHLNDFVENGSIRFDPGSFDLDMDAGMQLSKSVPITAAQEQTIRDFIEWKRQQEEMYNFDDSSLYGGPLALHIEFGGNANYAVSQSAKDLDAWGVKHLSYEGGQINASRIINDIRHYYRTGETRKPSTVAQFLYSDRDTDSVSNRSILANAFEGVAQNDIEKARIQEYKKNIDAINAEERKLQELRAKIKELSFAAGPKDKKAINELQFEANKTANRINTYDGRLLRLEASAPLKAVLEREKQKAYRRAKQRGEARVAEKVEGRKRTELRHKIRKTIRDLDKIFSRGDKKRNVKEGLRDVVASALASAEVLFTDTYTTNDMIRYGIQTPLTQEESQWLNEAMDILAQLDNVPAVVDLEAMNEWSKREAALKRDLSNLKSKLKGVFERERNRIDGMAVSTILTDLADSYKKLSEAGESYIQGAYDEDVYQHLMTIKDGFGTTRAADMRLDQLEALYDAYKMVLTTVRNANKMFAENIKESRDLLAAKVMMEVRKAGGEKHKWTKAGKAVNSFSWNNEKPIYAFERIGSAALTNLYHNIRKGQDTWAIDMMQADVFRRKLYKKYDFDGWDMEKGYEFTSSSGAKFSLNLQQIMSLYAYSKREQAHDHLLKGGFVFDVGTEVVENKLGVPVTYMVEDATAYNLSVDILKDIVSKLSTEQKSFVDEMQNYLSTTMGNKGNEVSMQLYGINLFKEKNYFPLRSAGQYMERAREANLKKEQGQVSLVSSGFTKSTTPKASNPVVLSDFMDVWAGHVNEMSNYHAFVLPMEDFRRVYNYSTPHAEGEQSASVNEAIQNAYGTAATAYIDQLYRDLNGGALSDSRENLAKRMMGLFKKGSVMASWSVVFQQPSSIGRAFALVDLKYFTPAPITNRKQRWEELKKYAPVAMIKEMGYFDTGMGQNATEYLQAEEYDTMGEKVKGFFTDSNYRDEILTRPAAVADEITWLQIWNAVKNETADKHPGMNRTSEAFLKLAGERFSEVIDKTQVYDSVLARSGNMRSKSLYMNIATAFMAEPTTSINMIEDAIRKGFKGNKKQAARTMAAVATSVVINSALASIIYAARDDDDDETYAEKYISSFVTKTMDGFNPIIYYPFLKDIWSAFQGYDIERSDMSVIVDLVDTLKGLTQIYAKDTSNMDDEQLAKHKKQTMDAWLKALDSITALGGIPMRNVRRDLNGVINMYTTIKTDVEGRQTTAASLADVVRGDIARSLPVIGWMPAKSRNEKLYDAITSGDDAYAERLQSGYKSEEAYHSAIRKAIRDYDPRIREAAIASNGNDYETYLDIVEEIMDEGHFDRDDVIKAIRSEASALAPEEGSGVSKAQSLMTAEQFAIAVANGDTDVAEIAMEDIIATAQENGKTESEAVDSFHSSAKNALKDQYLVDTLTEKAAEKALVDYCGMDEEEAAAAVRKWEFESESGFAYGDMHQEFLSGSITSAEAEKALQTYGGKTADEAAETVKAWEFEKKNGYAYSDRKNAFLEGKVSASALRRHMMEYDGMSAAEADNTIRAYEWMKRHPQYDMSVDDVIAYTKPIEKLGYSIESYSIKPEVFIRYKDLARNATGVDSDGYGKADTGSKKAEILEIINALPLTAKQKDALYYLNGWAASNLRKAPWH